MHTVELRQQYDSGYVRIFTGDDGARYTLQRARERYRLNIERESDDTPVVLAYLRPTQTPGVYRGSTNDGPVRLVIYGDGRATLTGRRQRVPA